MSFSGGNKFGNFDKFCWKQIYYPFFFFKANELGLSRAGNLDNWIISSGLICVNFCMLVFTVHYTCICNAGIVKNPIQIYCQFRSSINCFLSAPKPTQEDAYPILHCSWVGIRRGQRSTGSTVHQVVHRHLSCCQV